MRVGSCGCAAALLSCLWGSNWPPLTHSLPTAACSVDVAALTGLTSLALVAHRPFIQTFSLPTLPFLRKFKLMSFCDVSPRLPAFLQEGERQQGGRQVAGRGSAAYLRTCRTRPAHACPSHAHPLPQLPASRLQRFHFATAASQPASSPRWPAWHTSQTCA